MAKVLERLTQRFVDNLEVDKERLFADGGGLYLRAKPNGNHTFEFLYVLFGREEAMGMGSARIVLLKDVRDACYEPRRLLQQKISPLRERQKLQAQRKIEAQQAVVWQTGVARFIDKNARVWSAGYKGDFLRQMEQHIFPKLGRLEIASIGPELVVRMLEDFWARRPPTAQRLLGDCARVWAWLKGSGFNVGVDNPFEMAKVRLGKVAHKTRHQPALDYRQIPDHVKRLRALGDMESLASEWQILTCTRPIETIRAKLADLDLDQRLWVIPPSGHKMGHRTDKPHRIFLGDRAMEIARERKAAGGVWMFPSPSNRSKAQQQPLARDALLRHLRETLKEKVASAHGMRSAFSSWAADAGFPPELREMALGHAVGTEVERVYQRSDMLERRKALMVAWDRYCCGLSTGDNVVAFGKDARHGETAQNQGQGGDAAPRQVQVASASQP